MCGVCRDNSVTGKTGQVGESCIAVGTDVTGETDEDVDNYWALMPVTLNATGIRECFSRQITQSLSFKTLKIVRVITRRVV